MVSVDGKKLYESMDVISEALPVDKRTEFAEVMRAQAKWSANTTYTQTIRTWLRQHGF